MLTWLMTQKKNSVFEIFRESTRVYFTLLRILVPALIVVKSLELLGFTVWLGSVLAPLMGWLGLPDTVSVVWAATLLTNIYTGMVLFFEVARSETLTVAQVSVLGTLMIVAHAIPVEGAVARKVGAPWWLTLCLRIGGSLLLAWVLHQLYRAGGWLQYPNELAWQPKYTDESLMGWALVQIQTLTIIFFVILALITSLKLFRLLGIERLLHLLLNPFLRLLGVSQAAANTIVIGAMLGLSFGAGLLIQESRTEKLSPRDALLAVSFLGLCHSLIEDTLLILLLGADLSAVLWARLLFAFLVIGVLSRLPAHFLKHGLQPATNR
jgi:hypothetical protein|tara:strand:- start:5724 stop:6692 length:969 start_codon:yes stop_codon:yes gene_type:complete